MMNIEKIEWGAYEDPTQKKAHDRESSFPDESAGQSRAFIIEDETFRSKVVMRAARLRRGELQYQRSVAPRDLIAMAADGRVPRICPDCQSLEHRYGHRCTLNPEQHADYRALCIRPVSKARHRSLAFQLRRPADSLPAPGPLRRACLHAFKLAFSIGTWQMISLAANS